MDGENCVRIALWKFESQFFGKEALILGVDLLEGDVESWHNSGPLFGVGHHVVLVVEKLEVDHLVDFFSTVVPEIIELVERMGVVLEFVISDIGRDVFDVVPSLIVINSNSKKNYISLTWGVTSGEYYFVMMSLGLSCCFRGRRAQYSYYSLRVENFRWSPVLFI